MTEDEARQARMRTQARDAALAAKRVERISELGIGRADSQRVSTETLSTAVAELEREIDRLQHRLENQARTIKVQEATIRAGARVHLPLSRRGAGATATDSEW